MTSELTAWDESQEVSAKGVALVLESDPFSYALLSASLDYLGYSMHSARDFVDAEEKLSELDVTLVVIDVSSNPVESVEFSKEVKRRSEKVFLPLLCMCEEHDEEYVLACIEAGADDYIIKPFSVSSLKSRLLAMEKALALHRELERKHHSLSQMHEEMNMDQVLAKRIFQRLITDRNTNIPQTEIQQKAAAVFCGDLVLCAYMPSGGIRVLVGDFTGHGLAAALGAIPVANIFHAMNYKGCGDYELLAEINRKLYEVLPTDLFMAVCLVSFEAGADSITYWNGGMPPMLLIGEAGVRELMSFNLPLGITERLSAERQSIRVAIERNDRLVILSDGVTEAEDAEGQMLGDDAIYESIESKKDEHSYLGSILHRLNMHTLDAPQADDITGVEIALWELVNMDKKTLTEGQREDYWAWKVTLENDRLASVLPVQNLLRESGLLAGYEKQMTALETIVDELYNNALDHGVLRLDSRLKELENGFGRYYEKRDALLASNIKGKITLALGAKETEKGKQIEITVSDSGGGFNYSNKSSEVAGDSDFRPWGRGLKLVEQLSDSVTFSGYGNVVTAIYTLPPD